MGNYFSMDVDIRISRDRRADCLDAINALFAKDKMEKNASGSTSISGRVSRHYACVEAPMSGEFDTLANAFREWRYNADFDEHDDSGTLFVEEFTGEKWGDDEVLFKAIAPFVLSGTVYVTGEDDESWGYEFKRGKVYKKNCRKVWTTERKPL